MLIKCPECSKEISDQAAVCPHCGKAIAAVKEKHDKQIGCLAVFIVCVIALLLFQSLHKPDQADTTTATTGALPSVTDKVENHWVYSEDKDPISGAAINMACIQSDNNIEQTFPYHPVPANLCIRRRGGSLDASVQLNGDGQVLCEAYEGCGIPIRFDALQPHTFRGAEASDHSTNIVFIVPASSFLSSVKKAGTTKVQVRIYEQGDQTLSFDTSGLKQEKLAIRK